MRISAFVKGFPPGKRNFPRLSPALPPPGRSEAAPPGKRRRTVPGPGASQCRGPPPPAPACRRLTSRDSASQKRRISGMMYRAKASNVSSCVIFAGDPALLQDLPQRTAVLFPPLRGRAEGAARYGGRIFILGLQIYILWFILKKQPKISLFGQAGPGKAALRAEGGNFRGGPPLSGSLPRRSGQVFPCEIGKRERDERHESYQAQRHGGGL